MPGFALEVDFNTVAYPLELDVNLLDVGGVPGLVCTVAIRMGGTTGLYLDWTTNTFKLAGWGVRNQPMMDLAPLAPGVYQAMLSVAALGFNHLTPLPVFLIAEFNSTGAGTSGLAVDYLTVSELRPDAKVARQYNTNRLDAISGNPGQLILFQDDGVTVETTQTLNDFTGGAIIDSPGVPTLRGKV